MAAHHTPFSISGLTLSFWKKYKPAVSIIVEMRLSSTEDFVELSNWSNCTIIKWKIIMLERFTLSYFTNL